MKVNLIELVGNLFPKSLVFWFCLEATTSTSKSLAKDLLYVCAGDSFCFQMRWYAEGIL